MQHQFALKAQGRSFLGFTAVLLSRKRRNHGNDSSFVRSSYTKSSP